MENAEPRRVAAASPAPWWLLWVAFVVYGSLVPLEYRPLAWADAVARFRELPMLSIGVEGRADWIANGVLYLPVGFLTTAWLAGADGSTARRGVALLAGAAFGCALAFAVEFAQLWFPQRTVSLNDLLAECLGSVLGAVLAARWAGALRRLLATLAGHAPGCRSRLPAVYALAYVALALFPYDLLLSAGELADKAGGTLWGWWLAPAMGGSGLRTGARLAAEALTVLPVGWWFARRAGRPGPAAALLAGAAFGIAIEGAQFFVASGVSQGASVLSRALGFALAAWVWQRRAGLDAARLRETLRRLSGPAGALYVAAVFALAGWFGSPWRDAGAALARLATDEVRFVPFYYHYYTSEALALLSLTSIALLYAPVGAFAWAWRWPGGAAALAAGALAAVVGFGKLFPEATRPDPTNVWIAAAVAGLVATVAARLADAGAAAADAASPAAGRSAPSAAAVPHHAGPVRLEHAWLAVAAALATGVLVGFPLNPILVGVVVFGAAALIWWRPLWLFAIVPVALPLFDLAHWSGRTLVDEFDLLLGLGVAAAWARRPVPAPPAARDPALNAALAAVALVLAVAAARSWWTGADGGGSFSSPIGPLNGLRIAKGALWALLLIALARRHATGGERPGRAFAAGMAIGLGGTVAVVLWERIAFVSLFDFEQPYRVSGPFYAMHTGGAYIEGFLVCGLAYAAAGLALARHAVLRVAATLLTAGAVYALAVTLSRGGYAAAGWVVAATALLLLARARRAAAVAAGVLVGLSIAVAYPVVSGPAASARLATVSDDLQVRIAHWTQAWRLRDEGFGDLVFGIGLGAFPARNFWQAEDGRRPAVHGFERDRDGGRLRLGPGPALYVDQLVDVPAGERMRVRVEARAVGGEGRLAVSLCRKWLLTSFDCTGRDFALAADRGAPMEAYLDAVPAGGQGLPAWRPLKFSLANVGGSVIEVTRVSLVGADGRERLVNGRFAAGADRWTFTADDHLAWHVKNLPLAVLLEAGLVGAVAFVALGALALARAARAAWSGSDASAAVAGIALVAFLLVGLFDTLIDTPRFLLLMLLLCGLAALRAPSRGDIRVTPRSSGTP